MSTIRRMLARLAALLRRDGAGDDDLRAEMELHVALQTEANIRSGMDPREARRQALLASGGLVQAAESVREQRGLPWLENLVADLRFAVRHFRRTPLSTVTMIVVLSLGIGTTVVLFTVLSSLATMPAPGMSRDDSVVRIRGTLRAPGFGGVRARDLSWPEVQEYVARRELFSSVAAYANESAALDLGDAGPTTVDVIYTTREYFGVMGVRPALGSVPVGDEGVQATTAPAAMISHALWQQRFGGASDVIGRTIRLNGVPVQISGVAPPRFLGSDGGSGATLWMPLGAYPLLQNRTSAVFSSPDSMFLRAAARLRPGVTPAAATPVVAGIGSRVFRAAPRGTATQVGSREMAVLQDAVGSADVAPMLASNGRARARSDDVLSILAAAGFALLILLITCTNVSALMVGLAAARRREIGVRLSLGAPRSRLLRQLLTESVLLALIAAAVGLIVTSLGIHYLGGRLDDVQLIVDWRVVSATSAMALLTGILFGASPALHATRVSVGTVLKSSATAVAATRSRLQRALVIAQIALTQPLLVGMGVAVVTLATDAQSHAVRGVPDHIAEVELDTWVGGVTVEERAALISTIVERVAALPGVTAAMPMQMGTISAPLVVHPDDHVAGITPPGRMEASLVAAPPGWLDAFEIPLVRGRAFSSAEYAHSHSDPLRILEVDAVIIGSDLARRLWGSADPIGRRLVVDGADRGQMMVVGIVDAAAAGPAEVNGTVRVYIPFSTMNTGVVARTAGPAQPMLGAMRQLVAAEAPHMPVARAQTMAQRITEDRRELLRTSGAVAGGGLLALLLSAIGLYAVVSFGVSQRTREIGIRTALGARSSQVVRMFFRQGLVLSAIGLALGLPLSILVSRFISTTLSWPLTRAPLLGVGVAVVVLAVASIAVWIPARRASGIDPLVALRLE